MYVLRKTDAGCVRAENGLGPHGAFLSKVTGAVVDTHPAFALGGEGATLPLKGEVTSLCVPRLSISTVFRCFFLAAYLHLTKIS